MKNHQPKSHLFNYYLMTTLLIVVGVSLAYIQIFRSYAHAAVLPSLPPAGSWAEFPNSALRPAMGNAPWNPKFIFDYSGGTFDEGRSELIIWGGGHADYPGNEVYAFSLTTGIWMSLTQRSPYTDATLDMLADGNPGARHTYGCFARVNLPGYDGFFCHGGSLWRGGWPVNGTWFFHRDTKTWEKLPPRPLWGESTYGATSLATFATFDPVSKRVLVLGKNACMAFDFATKAWERKGSCNGGEFEKSAALDPERRLMVVMGAGSINPTYGFRVFDISKNPWTLVRSSLIGDQTPVLTRGTGLVFDPVGKRYIAHTGGQNLWVIDRDTWTVSVLPGAGANPGPMYPGPGNMGRFRYVPSTNGLVVVNSIDGNVFYYQLGGTPPPPPPPPPIDTQAPTVSLLTPTNGSTVSGTINVSANASDNTGVVGVQFKLDGANLGSEDVSSPYSVSWNTTLSSNASHTLTATARDAAGNLGTASNITVTVNNVSLGPIPTDTWVAIKSPTNLLGPGYTATLYEKHLSLAYSPKTKRIYFHGGDTQKYMVGPDGVNYGGTSYYQGMHSLDLNLRLTSPGQVNAGWATEHSFCSTGTDVQPKHPDFVGIQWVPWLDKLVIVPGLFYVHHINCPGEAETFASDPQYPWRVLMSFDIATKKWSVMSTNNGLINSNAPWHFYADPVSKTFARVLNSGAPLEAQHYNPANNTWTRYKTTGNALDCTHSHLAILDRKMYCVSRGNGLFGVYDLDAHTAAQIGALPGDSWPADRVPSDKGYVFSVPGARKIIYAERLAVGTAQYRIWAWSPEAPTWVRIDNTLPWKTLDGEVLPAGEMPQGSTGILDPDTGILYLTGCYDCSTKYSWAIKLSSSNTPPPSDTIPPIVSITSPTNGSTVSGTITVSANASDNIGVSGVQFKLDGVNLGAEDTLSPYSTSWDTATATNVSHTLTAVARDQAGNTGTSPAVAITVSNVAPPPPPPPSSGPVGYWKFDEGLGTTAGDSSGLNNNGTLLNGPVWTTGRVLGALQFDGVNDYVSLPNTVINGQSIVSASFWLKTSKTGPQGIISGATTPAPGDNNFLLFFPSNTSLSLYGRTDTGAPLVTWPILSISNNVWKHFVVIANTVTDQGTLYIDGVLQGTKNFTQPRGAFTVNSGGLVLGQEQDSVGGGFDSLQAFQGLIDEVRVYNRALSSTEVQSLFNDTPPPPTDTTPPTAAITSPLAGATVSGTITVSANASDNIGVSGVQFKLDGTNLGTEDIFSPYSISWNTALSSNASHTLTATARDAAGNQATSPSITVSINNTGSPPPPPPPLPPPGPDTTPPTASITSPLSGATVSGTITVLANALDNIGVVGVQFKLDGSNLGAEVTEGSQGVGGGKNYSLSWNTASAANGNHTLTAVARDQAGNTGTSPAVAVTVSNIAPPPPQPPPPTQTHIPIYFTYAINDNDPGPYTLDNNSDLVNTAIIQAKWALLNPARGVYDWSSLDKKLSDWTAADPTKKMIIRISPYTGDCERDTPFGDNDGTPKYIYDSVPRITFDGGGVCKTKTDKNLLISVPKVWDPKFLPLHEEFLTALANRYNNDPRVAGFQIGFGHIGTWNAQPSSGGGDAFVAAGWTLPGWEAYTKNVIDAYKRHFTKTLMVRTARKFLAGQHCGLLQRDPCGLGDNPDTAKRILGYAAQRGVNVFLSGLDPNPTQFKDALISELTTYLGNVSPQPPSGFTLIYGDDFPLWVPPDRQGCPGNTCGRDEAGFDKELSYIFDAWKSINKKYPIAVNFLEPEMSTTNQSFAPCPSGEPRETKCFRQTVYDVAVKWLSTPTTPPPPPTPPVPQNAFLGQYYDNMDLTNLKVTRTDAAINFNWGSGSPNPVIGPDTFSVRWEGNWNFATAGTYRFTAQTDDGFRMWIDSVLVLDKWINQSPTTYAIDKNLTQGTHRIKVEYFENGGGATARLNWSLVESQPPIGSRVTPNVSGGVILFSRLQAIQTEINKISEIIKNLKF